MYIIFTDLYELWLIEILLRLRSRILGCVLRGALQLIRQMFSWLADHTHSCLQYLSKTNQKAKIDSLRNAY